MPPEARRVQVTLLATAAIDVDTQPDEFTEISVILPRIAVFV
jgi:hypothetical protein